METNSKTAPIVQEKDKNSMSLDLMHRMKMHGMAAFQESIQSTVAESMTPDGFLSWLLAREWDYRANAAIERAAFRYKACLEEIDYGVSRGLDRNQMERLASLDSCFPRWVTQVPFRQSGTTSWHSSDSSSSIPRYTRLVCFDFGRV